MLAVMLTRCVSLLILPSSNLAPLDTLVKSSRSRKMFQSASIAQVRALALVCGGATTDQISSIVHPVPKTFAVCTIRSTPSTAHHCIAWAKSYLFPYVMTERSIMIADDIFRQLFGADDEADNNDLDEAEKNGENGTRNASQIEDTLNDLNSG